MMAELKKYKLGEIAEIYNGSTPSTFDSSNYDGDIIWATPKDLSDQNSKYFSQGARNITQKGFDSCSTQIIPANNILMSSRAPIGLFAINTVDCCTNQGFKNIVLDKSIADVDFMYYFLKYHVKEIEALGSGTTFREVSKTAFEKYEISIPALPIQQKISAILSNIDRKISVNREINRNLEELAKQIYNYWFVQFDFPNEDGKPYKTSGGKMVWNELLKRDIPEGWEVGKIGDFVEIITKGTSPSTVGFEFTKTGVNFIKVECIENGNILTDNLMHISEEANIALKRSQLQENDILVTIAGRLGSSAVVSKTILPANTNQAVGIIRLKKNFKFLANYLYEQIISEDVQKHLQGANAQSIQKNLSLPNLADITFAYDKELKILSVFNEKILSIFNNQLSIGAEIDKLISLRDTLLPLLMNGQVTLNSCLSHD